MTTVDAAPERVRTLTLFDQVRALSDPDAEVAVRRGLGRLDSVVSDPAEYVERMRATGPFRHWEEQWDLLYRHELAPATDGYRPTTSADACLEDLGDPDLAGLPGMWSRITVPTLVVRAREPVGGGLTLTDEDLELFRVAVPGARVVEVGCNHYDIMTARPTVDAVGALLRSSGTGSSFAQLEGTPRRPDGVPTPPGTRCDTPRTPTGRR